MAGLVLRGYYAIFDVPVGPVPSHRSPAWEALLLRARQLLAASPCCLQLRAKAWTAAALCDLAAEIGSLCRAAGVPFCVNDRLDVALVVAADMVHLGQDDLPLLAARRVAQAAGHNLVVGVSTHNLAQAHAAFAAGADYIGFGPVFPTSTKDNPDPVVGLQALRDVCAAVAIPVVAIGGISRQRVAEVAAAGASAAAVISDVDRAPDRTIAGRQVAACFSQGSP